MAGSLVGLRYGCSSSEAYNVDKQRVDLDHEATYLFYMDEADREDDVVATTGCPAIGDPSPISFTAKCIDRQVEEIAPGVWEVLATFSNNYKTDPNSTDPPENRDPIESWGYEILEEPLLYDARDNTKAIRNSAGEPLPPVTHPVAIPVLTVELWKTTEEPSQIIDFVNTLNESAYKGASAEAALMAGITITPDNHDGTEYWKYTYTIKFNLEFDGWALKLLDEGTYYWTGGAFGSGQKQTFGDDAFQQVVGNLDGSGGENTTTTPAFVQYNRYRKKDWTALGLPA